MSKKTGVVLGVDVGTTNTVVAILGADGCPQVVHNQDGETLTPSVVHLKDEDHPVVGRSAIHLRALAPHYTIGGFKRSMGLCDATGAPLPTFVHPDSGRSYSAIDLSAILLRHVAEGASAALGQSVQGVVVTVPAYFDSVAREATRRAGEQAGLNVLQVFNEPTAAGWSFGLSKVTAGYSLVYDFGGGTFDVSILQQRAADLEVKATDGDRNLGGSDIDNLFLRSALEALQAEHGIDLTPESDLAGYLDVLDKCENAKKTLSQATSVSFVLSVQGKQLIIDLSRAEFDDLIVPLIQKTREITCRALQAANLTPADIADVLLVGGSTRIVAVRTMLTTLFGKAPRTDTRPDEAVALGAALLAAQRGAAAGIAVIDGQGLKVLPPTTTVTDVTSHSLGCLALRNGVLKNCVIIPVNTRLPAECKQVFALSTGSDTVAEVTITTGVDDADPKDCPAYGNLRLAGLPPRDPGRPSIEVTYGFTVEGVLTVTIKDLISGKCRQDLVPIPGA